MVPSRLTRSLGARGHADRHVARAGALARLEGVRRVAAALGDLDGLPATTVMPGLVVVDEADDGVEHRQTVVLAVAGVLTTRCCSTTKRSLSTRARSLMAMT